MLSRLLALAIAIVALPAAAQAGVESDSTVRAKVRALLVLTRSDETAQLYLNQVFATLVQRGPSPLLDALREDFTVDVMSGIVVDLYVQHFTAEEIDEITAFYDSPFGRKYIALRPTLTQETIAAAQAWLAAWVARYEETNR